MTRSIDPARSGRALARFLSVTTLSVTALTACTAGQAREHPAAVSEALPVSSPWKPAELMSIARLAHTATLLKDGTVLIVGGASTEDGPALSSVEIYDPTKFVFNDGPAMSEPRVHHTATLLSDGKVLVVGGTKRHAQPPALATAEIYNPTTKSWTKTGSLPTERAWHSANLLSDGSVLIAGGGNTTDGASLPPVSFDPASNAFKALVSPGLNVPSAAVSVGLAEDRVIYFGGLVCCNPLSTYDVIVYEGATKKFSKVGTLRRPRVFKLEEPLVAAAPFAMGKQVLVIGGVDDSGELWQRDAASGTWSSKAAGDLADPWGAPTMVTNAAGDAIAVGGFVANPATPTLALKLFPTSLLRHHATGKWADASPPDHRRWSHTATALADGGVLITGGRNKDGVLRDAEVLHTLDLGSSCALGGDCASASCVDSVCCEASCDGQCQACNKEGKCVAVTGAPRGLRPLCVDPGGDVCKAQTCNGSDVAVCNLPKANRCAPAACSGSTFSPESKCDGMGSCNKPASLECKPFGCTDTGCRTTCATVTDCANGFVCSAGKCIETKGTTCKPDLSAQVTVVGGEEKACSPYLCKVSSGACADVCLGSADCAGGFVCNTNHCEPAPSAADTSSGGCNLGGETRGGGAPLRSAMLSLVAGTLLTSLARRRRR